ncbi:MAG: outer membrane lipid asymmetry maintenance protein MlaD [Betaproteobacteria bacterium]|nr:outer membrane lipid asymmetry maintenance protein MlaD [Betaproteobacteria bacterium]
MERKNIDLMVGIFLLMGVIALLVLALRVGNLGSERVAEIYSVEARFENIGGLKQKAPVKSAGVLVGRVTDIRFDNQKFQAAVTLTLDKRYSFPKDTSASILTSGLLGEVYIGLEAGGDDKNLQNNDKITLTQSAVVLERLIGQFMFSKAAEGTNDKPAEKK